MKRYVAFSGRPYGGNPAGVVPDAAGLGDDHMLAIAAGLGHSETAFRSGTDIRFFSPVIEVPFWGQATIATAVALAERDGPGEVVLTTAGGPVPVMSENWRRDSGPDHLSTSDHALALGRRLTCGDWGTARRRRPATCAPLPSR